MHDTRTCTHRHAVEHTGTGIRTNTCLNTVLCDYEKKYNEYCSMCIYIYIIIIMNKFRNTCSYASTCTVRPMFLTWLHAKKWNTVGNL